MKNFLKRWTIFIKERFAPTSHLLLIIFYYEANALVAFSLSPIYKETLLKHLLGLFVVMLMFLHLRIFDEIKDFKLDRIIHPNRPLARGIIKILEAKKIALLLIIMQIIVSAAISIPALISACFVIIYSLIMYKEFFISNYLRARLATYALTHTLVACLISLFIFSTVTKQYFWMISKEYALFALANWMIFNVFEFGRKIFGKKEEQKLIDSYSKRFGSWKAAIYVLFMATVAVIIAFIIGFHMHLSFLFFTFMALLFAIIFISAAFYGCLNSVFSAKYFRMSCSIFILFYNVIMVFGLLIKRCII